MEQKDYLFESIKQATQGISDIRDYLQHRPHADALITLYAGGVEQAQVENLLQQMDDALPDVKRAGISEYAYGAETAGAPFANVRMNLLLSETSRFHVIQIPCNPGGEDAAAVTFWNQVSSMRDLQGVALYPSNSLLDVSMFLQRASFELQGVPFFGAMAASADEPFFNRNYLGAYSIGPRLLPSGFTAVAFCGKDLRVMMDYALGWRPVGREMDATLKVVPGWGGSCVSEIDGCPAVQVYDKYLGVKWNENFVANVCEFPLMVERNGVYQCMVPVVAGESGEMFFSGSVHAGEKMRLSYGTRESVLGASKKGSIRMRDFGAQAVFMSVCGNRALFLGDEAHVEWDMYREANPQLAYCHGDYEIGWVSGCKGECDGRGGVLTSALVAMGLREGGDPVRGGLREGENAMKAQATISDPREGDLIPLSHRVARFFDVLTGELVHLQHNLEEEVELKTRENEDLMLHVVLTLAAAIDAKDTYTNGHSARVAKYSREIARRAGYGESRLKDIYVMGVLHDVGKIGVPDTIINKPGKLTDEEFALMKTHPATGAQILSAIKEMPGLAVGAHWHHERYDGRGYPDGLAGEDIPEEARIIAVADAYDAMTSYRSYRDAMPQAKVREQVEQGRGTQFDPYFADIMLAMIDEDTDYRMREMRSS